MLPAALASVIIVIPPNPPWPEPEPAAPVFLDEPADVVAIEGMHATFSAYVTGGPSPTLVWERRPAGTAEWSTVSAEDRGPNGLQFIATLDRDGEQFRGVATNSLGIATSRVATLRVRRTPPLLFFYALPRTAAPGDPVTLAPAILGSAPLSFQWAKNGVPIPGATQATLDLPSVQAGDAGVYSITVTNDLGAARADVTTLGVTALPAVTLVPAYATPAEGDSFFLQAQANGGTLQWSRDGEPLDHEFWNYVVDAATPQHAGRYRVSSHNGAGTTWSNEVVVEVLPPAPPRVELRDLELVQWGGNIALSPTVHGVGPFSFQWYRDGEPIPGATGQNLQLNQIGIAELGAYFVAVTNAAGTTLSRTVDLEPLAEDGLAPHHWRQMHVLDGVAYFLYADSPRIERYDLATRDWLASWTLPFTPVAFAFATDALYVASESAVWRHDRNFGSAAVLVTSSERLLSVGVLGEFLVTVSSSDNFTIKHRCYQRSSGALLHSTQEFYGIDSGLSYDAVSRRIYGRREQGSTWSSHRYLQLRDDGSYWSSFPHIGSDYSSFGRTWVLSAGRYFAEASGHVWSITDETVKGNFGRMTDDAIEDGEDGFLALRHGRISRHDADFREIGTYNLGVRARRLARHGNVVFGFRQPASGSERAGVNAIELLQVQPPSAGPAIDPHSLEGMWSPQVEYDGAEGVYVYSRIHRTVWRWSLREARFEQAISLPAAPETIAFSPRRQRLYFALNRTQIWQHALDSSASGAAPFAGVKDRLLALVEAGGSVFASTLRFPFNTGTRNYLFNAAGEQVGAARSGGRSDHFAWSEQEQRLFTLLHYVSPSNLEAMPVNPNTGLGTEMRTPYHTSSIDFSGPLRVAETGGRVILGSGRVFETRGLTLAGHVLKRLTDATWGTDSLFTVRPAHAGTRVEAWNTATWEVRASGVVPGQPLRVWQLRGDRLLVVTLGATGRIQLHFLSSHTLEVLGSADPQEPPEIVAMDGDAQIEVGGAFMLAVSTRGGALPNYQWQVRLAASAGWYDLQDDAVFAGTRSGRLEARSLPAQFSGARFRVVVTNAGGEVISPARSVASHGPAGVVALAGGDSALALIRFDHALWTLGTNESGRLGLSDYGERKVPKPTAADAVKAVLGPRHLAWQSRDGRWWASGADAAWLPGPAIAELPRLIGDDIAEVAFGDWHALFLRGDGSLWGGGSSSFGQLLLPGVADVPMHRMATGVVAVAAAGSHSLWLTSDGVLWGAGLNSMLQLGAAAPNASGARQVATEVSSMAATPERTFFVKRDHTLWWIGQLNETTGSSTPVQIAGQVKSVSASPTHVVFVRLDGSVWSLGRNENGQLGDGTTGNRWQPAPVAMGGLRDVVAGANFTAGLDGDGSVWVCGQVSYNVHPGAQWTRLASGVIGPSPRELTGTVKTTATPHGVALQWAPVAGASGYEVWRGTLADVSAATRLQVTPGGFFLDAGALDGTDLHYWVRPVFAQGPGAFSNAVTGQRGESTAPRITTHPQDTDQTNDYYAELNFAADGDPVPTLHWEMRAPGAESWTVVPNQWPNAGAQTPRLRVYVTASTSGTQYRGVATNSQGQAFSNSATVTRRPMPFVIWSQPQGGAATEGKSFTLSVTVSGASMSPSFQWKKDGAVLPGRTSGTLILNPVTAADAGSYTVVATAPEGVIESNPAVVTVVPEPPKAAAFALAAGQGHSVFLVSGALNGGMGANTSFQTGTLVSPQPVRIAQLHTRVREFTAIAAGANHTLLLTSNGSLFAIGENSAGQAFGSQDLTVVRATNVAAMAAGAAHSLVLRFDGTVHGIGSGASGQIGGGGFANRTTLTQFATAAVDVAAGAHHSMFIKEDASLWGVGANLDGQLAQPTLANLATPVQIAEDVTQADGGENYTVFLRRDGTLWGVGRNSRGQLGASIALGALTTAPVLLAEEVRFVAAGAEHLLFIKRDDTLWGLGRNDSGQLGTGELFDRSAPVLVAAYAACAAAGQAHSLWIDEVGSLWACGDNVHGQLGAGSTEAIQASPVRVWTAAGTSVPARPTLVTASDNNVSGGVRLTWQGIPGAMHYEVRRSESPDSATAVPVATERRVPIYFDQDAARQQSYYYWVAGVNQAGRSSFSVRDYGVHGLPAGGPQISSGPNSTSVTLGNSLTLTVNLSNVGSPVMVQWRRNGVAFGPATPSQTLTISRVTFAHAGEWDAMITNASGSAMVSRVAEIEVRVGGNSLSLPSVASRAFSAEPFEIGPAVSSAGLPVLYTVVSGPAEISGNRLTATGVGAVEVRAEQPGDGIIPAATPVTVRFAILPAEAQMQLLGLVRAYDGTAQAVTVSVTPAVPVSITYDGIATPPSEVGSYLVRAQVAEQSGHVGTLFAYLTITKAPQTIVFSAPAYLEADGRTHTLQASASSMLPVLLTLTTGDAHLSARELSATTPTSVSIRASQSGDAHYDPAPDVVRSIVFLPPNLFSTWQRMRFAGADYDNAAVSGVLSDPDHDGVSNLLEFAVGRNPLVPETEPILEVWREEGGWCVAYQRPAQRPDLLYRVEASLDLVTWSDAEIEHTRFSEDSGMETWLATRDAPGDVRVFFRLRVEHAASSMP